ncbi:MAG: hybrid sensor histidine kinase/response regulator [Pseudanabaena sp.]|nr:MAG: hybrid sensor histidine kinase/response regulator [Pseudanabaena sp.]
MILISKDNPQKLQKNGMPLNLLLVVPFVVQIFAAVGITGYISLRNGQQSVNELVGKLRENSTKQISHYLSDYFSAPHQINQINQEAIASGLLDLQDFDRMGRLFWLQMQIFNVGYINFANPEREFIGSERLDDRQLVLHEIRKKTPSKFFDRILNEHGDLKLMQTDYILNERGDRKFQRENDVTWDTREEGWYAEAVKRGKPIWTKIYQWGDKPVLSISLSYPIYDKKNNLAGVLGVDLILSQINSFLRSIPMSPSSRTFVLERNGLIVSSSSNNPFFEVVDDKVKRINALQSSDPIIRAGTEFLQKKFNGLTGIDKSYQLEFFLEDTSSVQFLQVTPWRDNYGLDWLVVVVVPESDFMAQINANTRTTILLSLAALAIAILVGMITSSWLSRPIQRLSKAAAAIADGELETRVNIQGIKELEILSTSFNRMASELQESFNNLEVKVANRTFEMQKAKEQSEFLANMSHELRTPLNAILGFTQIMNRDRSLNKSQLENLSIIERSGEHLLSLINDILDMAKIESGRIALHETDFDLQESLYLVAEMFQMRAETKRLYLKFEQSEDLPQYIRTDEKKLRQVLINLISNSLKFTQTGGITVVVKLDNSGIDDASSNTKQVNIRFLVTDTGVGIADEEAANVFDPFIQTESGRKFEQGTGLGLAISRKFVQLMGGDITFNSEVGIGTIFEFNIRAELSESAKVIATRPIRPVIGLAPNQKTYRILVVDDRRENRQILIKLLAPIGFEVKEADNGQVAVKIWEQWQPHLIWMDMRMPIMNGYEATTQIRSHLKGQATTIIALTASTLEEERAIVLSTGCDDFVRKPFLEDIIFEKLSQYLGVQFIYEAIAPSLPETTKSVDKFTAQSLLVMPKEWLEKLHRAASQLDGNAIAQLLTQVPEEHFLIAKEIEDHANNFDFDRIIALVKEACSL